MTFCRNCHGRSTATTASNMHWQALRRAHPTGRRGSSNRAFGTLDAASRRCLACHDGLNATEPGNHVGFRDSGSLADPTSNHPIGVPYPAAGRRLADAPLRPASLLPDSVQLPSGVVSCVSCHDLYNSRPGRLSVPIEGSRLCLTCHAMD